MEKELTQKYLQELLEYDQDTGIFRWKVRPRYGIKNGSIAGNCRGDGYICIQIKGKIYKAHRLAWLYVYGIWPSGNIDHINRNPCDNGIINLRDTNQQVNNYNRSFTKSNKLRAKGVVKRGSRYQATIKYNGKQEYLGRFDSIEEAQDAYNKAYKLINDRLQ